MQSFFSKKKEYSNLNLENLIKKKKCQNDCTIYHSDSKAMMFNNKNERLKGEIFMKTSKRAKILGLVIGTLMLMSIVPMVASAADPSLTIGAITMDSSVAGELSFVVPYTATEVDQVTVLAVMGGATEPVADATNIVYIDQQASTTATSFGFKVDTTKLAGQTKIYIKIGGTAITSAVPGTDQIIPQAGVSVTGYVETYSTGATITITKVSDSTVVGTTTTNADGLFTFTQIAPGDYNLAISAKSALTRTIPVTVATTNNEVSLVGNKVTLKYGDTDGNGKIELDDLMAIKGTFNKLLGAPEYNANYDLDSNGKIELDDLMAIKGNFNQTISNYLPWVK